MIMAYSKIEFFIFNILNTAPYIAVFLYAFKNRFRFSSNVTVIISAVLCGAYIITSGLITYYIHIHFYGYILFAFLICTAAFLIKASWMHLIFIILVLKNCANFVVVVSKYLEYLICPDKALDLYCWTYSAAMFLCQSILLPIIVVIAKKYFVSDLLSEKRSESWKFVWIIPLFFYYTWVFIFYFDEDTPLDRALQPENSIFLLFSIVAQMIIYSCLGIMAEKSCLATENQEKLYATELQLLQYRSISKRIDYANQMRHDLRHHLITISSLANESSLDKLTDYLQKQLEITERQTKIRYCKNEILNILLVYYSDKCLSGGIDYRVDLLIPEDFNLDESDTTIVFGNLLENAYEACTKQTEGERNITIRGRKIGYSVVFSIENTVPENYTFSDVDVIQSTKRRGEGVGTKSCKRIIESKNGSIRLTSQEKFIVEFNIPLGRKN